MHRPSSEGLRNLRSDSRGPRKGSRGHVAGWNVTIEFGAEPRQILLGQRNGRTSIDIAPLKAEDHKKPQKSTRSPRPTSRRNRHGDGKEAGQSAKEQERNIGGAVTGFGYRSPSPTSSMECHTGRASTPDGGPLVPSGDSVYDTGEVAQLVTSSKASTTREL